MASALPHAAAAQSTSGSALNEALRRRLESPGGLDVGGRPLRARQALPAVYGRRAYAPVWIDGRGRAKVSAESLRAAVDAIGTQGFDPADYRASDLASLAAVLSRPDAAAGARIDFDLLHTDAFLMLASHLVNGRVHPQTFDAEWIALAREVDVVGLLIDAIERDSIGQALAGLQPRSPGYGYLVDALAHYRRLAAGGGWAPIGDGPRIEPGSDDSRIAAIAQRLRATGDLADEATPALYDGALVAAVRHFQSRHGLEPDARIGPRTLAAMNVGADQRARQIELNLTRWRWLPLELGERHVVVNVAAQTLRAVEAGKTALEMRVIVGRPYRRTPVFSDRIRYLVLNPFWEIPPSLAVKDKLPLIREDPSYFAQQGIQVFSGWGAEEAAVDPATVDWSAVRGDNFRYRLRQDPGPLNALGRIKFMFPNNFNVYLHDTPAREGFKSDQRDLSSGCIRLEQPLDLAAWVLAGNGAWDRAAIDAAVASGVTRTIAMQQPVSVHLEYWTAWADENGTVHFRSDIYGRDALLDAALRERGSAGD